MPLSSPLEVFPRNAERSCSACSSVRLRPPGARQVAGLRKLVRRPDGGNLFMVTHGSTTYALAGESPGTGEMVLLTPQPGGGFRVAGRLSAG